MRRLALLFSLAVCCGAFAACTTPAQRSQSYLPLVHQAPVQPLDVTPSPPDTGGGMPGGK